MTRKLIPFLLAAALTLGLTFISPLRPEAEENELPEWYSQWFEMKKDANGQIPTFLAHQWAQFDRIQNKTNGTPVLDSVKNWGPDNIGGRTRALLVDWADTTHYFAGSVAGGLWESNNEGSSWHAIKDDQENLNISAITQSPFNKNIIYYCTGEPYPVADASSNTGGQLGGGVFKSTDGGKTFNVLTSTLNNNFINTWDIKHSLTDSNTIYVGTNDKGLFRSTDGGVTFTNVFPSTSAITRIQVLTDGSILIAQSNVGIFKSPNGNTGTFVNLNNGFAASPFGLIEFSVCKNFPNVMLAVVSASGNASLKAFYRSSNGGATWRTCASATTVGYSYTWFCLVTAICPTDTNKMFVGSVNCAYSLNGGTTWSGASNSHSDYHVLVTVPNSAKLLCGNDGGVFRYNWNNISATYTDLNRGYIVAQYYAGGYYPTGYSAIMGAQDNGTQRLLFGNRQFTSVFGADGCFAAVDQNNPDNGYCSYQSASLLQVSGLQGTTSTTPITFSNSDSKWFINPYEVNLLDASQMYVPTKNKLYRGVNGTFTQIITANTKQPYAVGISNDLNPVVYCGGSNMLLLRISKALTTVSGKEVALANTPATLTTDFVGCIKVHPNDSNTIFITLTNYNNQPRVWKITNTSTNPVWTSISGNLPASLPCNTIEVDPMNPDTKFMVGTDFGMYTTSDGGTTWQKETRIPNVCIYNIRLRSTDRKLFIFTHGRGLWTADVMPYITVKPTAKFTLSKSNICAGESILFSSVSDNYPTQFKWTFPGGTPSTSVKNAENVVFNTAGTYTVKLLVTNTAGTDSTTNTVTVSANPKPWITRSGDSLKCNTGNTVTYYEWYASNTMLTDHTPAIKLGGAGWYKVLVYNGNGCYASSDSLYFFAVGINKTSVNTDAPLLYPNPSAGTMNILYKQAVKVKIYSMNGMLLHTFETKPNLLHQEQTGNLPAGVYLIQMEYNGTLQSQRWIKQ